MKTRVRSFLRLWIAVLALAHCFNPGALAADSHEKVLDTKTVMTRDAKGNFVEKRIVKKMRTRTVIDFEEASIEGKVKKPNAAYLLHGADLDFKHLYRLRSTQKERVLGSYEYVR